MGSSTLGNILRGTLDGTPKSAGGFAAEAPPAAAPGSDISHLDHKYWKCVDTSSKDCSTQTKISSLGGHSPFAIYGHHVCLYSKELKCVNDLILKRLFCEKWLEQIFFFSLFFTCRRIYFHWWFCFSCFCTSANTGFHQNGEGRGLMWRGKHVNFSPGFWLVVLNCSQATGLPYVFCGRHRQH